MKATLNILLMIMTCTFVGVAGADTTTSRESIRVSFADLDLDEPSAQKTLYRRLKSAATRVCGPTQIRLTGSVARVQANKACFEESMVNALNSLDIPAVSALHDRPLKQEVAQN